MDRNIIAEIVEERSMAYLETETGRLDPWARPRNLPMAMLFLCMSAFMGAALFIYSRIGIRYDVWWWSIAVLGAVMLLISILLFVLAGLGKQYLWWNEPGSRKEFLEGPPDRLGHLANSREFTHYCPRCLFQANFSGRCPKCRAGRLRRARGR